MYLFHAITFLRYRLFNFPLFILRKKFMSHRPMSKIFDVIKSSSEVLDRGPHFLWTWRIDFPSFSQNCHSSHFLALCWNSKNEEKMAIFAQFGFWQIWQMKAKLRLIFWILAKNVKMNILAKVKKFSWNHAKNDYFDEIMRLRPIVEKRCGIIFWVKFPNMSF